MTTKSQSQVEISKGHKYNEDHDLTAIIVKKSTREHLRNMAKKFQTYDNLINELIKLKELPPHTVE